MTRLWLAAVMGAILLACGGEQKQPGWTPPAASEAPKPVTLSGPLRVPIHRGQGGLNIGIYVDESGSMNGFAGALPSVEGWVSHAISRIRSYGYGAGEVSNCGFSRAVGVECRTTTIRPRSMRGETNIDEAVRQALGQDVSIIITDGVAATGGLPSAICGSGVDAACVGNELADYLKAGGRAGGLWLVPLTLDFNGPFYTERVVPAAGFDQSRVQQPGAEGEVSIRRPRNTGVGELVYDYRGPRTLVMFIVARRVEAGRALVAALEEARAMESVHLTRKGDASFEVYPGAVPELRWTTAQRATDSTAPDVSHDAELHVDTQSLRFICGAGDQSQGEWELAAAPGAADTVASTLLRSMTVRDARINAPPNVNVTKWGLTPDSVSARIRIGCAFLNPNCQQNLELKVVAPRIGAVSDDVRQWSTVTPEYQPERAFGLEGILTAFYERVGQIPDARIATLRICSEKR